MHKISDVRSSIVGAFPSLQDDIGDDGYDPWSLPGFELDGTGQRDPSEASTTKRRSGGSSSGSSHAKRYRWIASDEMGGRGVDTEGLKRAGEFIANRWKELGFQVDAFDGTPFQDFTLPGPMRVGTAEKNKLLLKSPDGESVELELGSDFTPVSLGSNGTFEGELAFAGYGITAKDPSMKLDYDDYQSFDPKGKVVIVIRKEPQQNDDKSVFAGKDPSDFSFYTTKQANAASHGVAAMIMVNDGVTASSANGDQLPPADGAGRSFGRRRVPTLFAKREVMDRFLKKATGKGLADYESEIDKDWLHDLRSYRGGK